MSVATAFDNTPIQQNPTRRMAYSDFMGDFGIWLVQRFGAQYPQLAPGVVLGLLRSYNESNEIYMVRTAGSIIMAKLVRRLFNEAPYVETEFLFCRPDRGGLRRPESEAEGLDLLNDVVRWAKTMGCTEVRLPKICDIPVLSFKKMAEVPSQMTVHRVEFTK